MSRRYSSCDGTLPDYRLRPNIAPRHYDLSIITNLDPENFTFQGVVDIKIECLEDTNVIKLHARDLIFSNNSVTVKSAEGQNLHEIRIKKLKIDAKNEFFVLTTEQPLVMEHMYVIHIPFHGELKENLIGYYRSRYIDRRDKSTKWLAVTHFGPTEARQAFPCFDEPALKATFSIRLAHKDNFTSLSNMPLLKTLPFEERPGWVWDEFQPTVPMSTYLVAFMVSEFGFHTSSPQPNSHVHFKVWARPEALDQSKFAAQVGPQILSYYEDFFGIKYPLPKQDLLAIPDFNIRAMENWGIVTFRESLLLMDDKLTSSPEKLSIANEIAHELAHMWFGNLVTMEWWTDLWLKEGFATYMAGLSLQHEFPEWNSLDASALNNFLLVLDRDSLKTSHPMSVPIVHPNEISQIYDAISYDKSSYLLRMTFMFLGEEVFRHGVSDYLKLHQYKNTGPDDLWICLTQKAHWYQALPKDLTVKQIMDTWTLQAGYPLITADRDYDAHIVMVSQKRLLAVKSDNPDDNKGSWWVPLSYSTAKKPQFNQTQPQHWLSSGQENMRFDISASKDDWFILNNRASGLYRVNYDNDNWLKLIDILHSRHHEIDILNRVQLITDAMDLAYLGFVTYDLAFKVLSYLSYETDFLPWKAGITKLAIIDIILIRTPNYGAFKKFLRSLIAPVVKYLGKLTDEPDNFEKAQLFNIVANWACSLNLNNWGSDAIELFKKWRSESDPLLDNFIPKDVLMAVYSYAIACGGIDDWEFLWQRYLNVNSCTEKNHILRALTATKEIWLLNRYLEWSLDENSGIRKQDSLLIFGSIARRDSGFYLAKSFLLKNVQSISEYLGEKSCLIGKYFSTIAEKSVSDFELKELKEFANANEDLFAPGSLSVSQSLEYLRGNINWMNEYYIGIPGVLRKVYT